MKIKKLIINIVYPFFYMIKKVIFTKPQLRILMFHYITSEQYQKFENLIIKLKQEYNIVSPSEFCHLMKNKKKLAKDTILLTFDDGYKDISEFALPILKKYNFNATCFLVSNSCSFSRSKTCITCS